SRPAGRGGRPRQAEPPPVFVYVQVATDAGKVEADLEGVRAETDEQLADLEERTAIQLALQRDQLIGISSLTFAATILGTCWLVSLGLCPLRRLSDAVSRVSPKNFNLALGDAPLPQELRPIAERLGDTLELLRRAFAREKQATADISHELR